ncbi:MAG TPA: putative glycolipid-binding domain-containing protein [Thermoplasmata archaeon]|nr:putative glycolipid-binding domain-containing protein [Thermoplasmata archaeon]
MSPPRVLGRAGWRYLRHPGTDRATLSATDDGFRLAGIARLRFPDGATQIRYAFACDPEWRPQTAQVDLRQGREKRFLHAEISPDRKWTIDSFRHPELRGFTDIDLSASPSTNTLALRRLALPVGGSAEIDVAWIVFPDLEIRAVRQRYHRVSERHYRYEGLHNGFVAEFDVDEVGLVTDYPDFWEQIPPSRRRGARPRSPRRRS